MITIEQALARVRQVHPNDLIRSCFVWDNNYYFEFSPGKSFISNDMAVGLIIVDSKDGSLRY